MPTVVIEESARRSAVAEPERNPRSVADSEAGERKALWSERRSVADGGRPEIFPNALVRWAFYVSVFSLPFTRLYIPGTGERVGVIRIVQLLMISAVVSEPRICLRLVPVSLVWFLAYCVIRILSGLWFSRELWETWWSTTFDWLQFSLPWVWILFNVLQFPRLQRAGLWSFVWGCSLCAMLHIAGIGVTEVESSRH